MTETTVFKWVYLFIIEILKPEIANSFEMTSNVPRNNLRLKQFWVQQHQKMNETNFATRRVWKQPQIRMHILWLKDAKKERKKDMQFKHF